MSKIIEKLIELYNASEERANSAYNLRNKMLQETRGRLTTEGKAFSRLTKDEPPPLNKLIARRISKFMNIHDKEPTKIELSKSIIQSSGRSNMWVTRAAKANIVLGVASITYQVYDGVTSTMKAPDDQKHRVASYYLGRFGGSMLGGIGVGAGMGAAIGLYTVNPAIIFAGAIAGGIVGGIYGEDAVVMLLDEMWGEE